MFRAYGKLAFCIDATDPEEACRLYRKSLRVVREQGLYNLTGCKIAVTSIYNNYAWTLWNCLGSEEAIIYYGQALDLLEGYLGDRDVNKDMVISQMKHIGQALAKVYDQTNHANEKDRLIARLSEEKIEID